MRDRRNRAVPELDDERDAAQRDADARYDLKIDTTREGDTVVVSVQGEMDVASAPLLAAVLEGVCAQQPRRVDVDLGSVVFVDSAGLLALIAARRQLVSQGGDLGVRCPPGFLRRVFAATGLDRVFDLTELDQRPSLADADREAGPPLQPAGP